MTIPKVGQIWERDGKRREVEHVQRGITWKRNGQCFWCKRETWNRWASRAKLIHRVALIQDPSKETE